MARGRARTVVKTIIGQGPLMNSLLFTVVLVQYTAVPVLRKLNLVRYTLYSSRYLLAGPIYGAHAARARGARARHLPYHSRMSNAHPASRILSERVISMVIIL